MKMLSLVTVAFVFTTLEFSMVNGCSCSVSELKDFCKKGNIKGVFYNGHCFYVSNQPNNKKNTFDDSDEQCQTEGRDIGSSIVGSLARFHKRDVYDAVVAQNDFIKNNDIVRIGLKEGRSGSKNYKDYQWMNIANKAPFNLTWKIEQGFDPNDNSAPDGTAKGVFVKGSEKANKWRIDNQYTDQEYGQVCELMCNDDPFACGGCEEDSSKSEAEIAECLASPDSSMASPSMADKCISECQSKGGILINDSCYIVSTNKKSWSDAQSQCVGSLTLGFLTADVIGRLANFNLQSTLAKVANGLLMDDNSQFGAHSAWIGMKTECLCTNYLNDYRWFGWENKPISNVDFSISTAELLPKNSKSCVTLEHPNNIVNEKCETENYFICEYLCRNTEIIVDDTLPTCSNNVYSTPSCDGPSSSTSSTSSKSTTTTRSTAVTSTSSTSTKSPTSFTSTSLSTFSTSTKLPTSSTPSTPLVSSTLSTPLASSASSTSLTSTTTLLTSTSTTVAKLMTPTLSSTIAASSSAPASQIATTPSSNLTSPMVIPTFSLTTTASTSFLSAALTGSNSRLFASISSLSPSTASTTSSSQRLTTTVASLIVSINNISSTSTAGLKSTGFLLNSPSSAQMSSINRSLIDTSTYEITSIIVDVATENQSSAAPNSESFSDRTQFVINSDITTSTNNNYDKNSTSSLHTTKSTLFQQVSSSYLLTSSPGRLTVPSTSYVITVRPPYETSTITSNFENTKLAMITDITSTYYDYDEDLTSAAMSSAKSSILKTAPTSSSVPSTLPSPTAHQTIEYPTSETSTKATNFESTTKLVISSEITPTSNDYDHDLTSALYTQEDSSLTTAAENERRIYSTMVDTKWSMLHESKRPGMTTQFEESLTKKLATKHDNPATKETLEIYSSRSIGTRTNSKQSILFSKSSSHFHSSTMNIRKTNTPQPNRASRVVTRIVCSYGSWSEVSKCNNQWSKVREKTLQHGPRLCNVTLTEIIKCSPDEMNPLSPTVRKVAKVLQALGCSWLLGSCATCVAVSLLLKNWSVPSLIHLSEEVALALMHFIVVVGHDQRNRVAVCTLTSAGIQFCTTTVFALLALETLEMFSVVTSVVVGNSFLTVPKLAAMGIGVPFAITCVTLMKYHNDMISPFSCWLNEGSNVRFATYVPVFLCCCASLVMMEAAGQFSIHSFKFINHQQFTTAKLNQRSLLIMLPLHFAAWFVGQWAIYYQNIGLFSTVFGLNIALGCAMVFFHVLSNEKGRRLMQQAILKIRRRSSAYEYFS